MAGQNRAIGSPPCRLIFSLMKKPHLNPDETFRQFCSFYDGILLQLKTIIFTTFLYTVFLGSFFFHRVEGIAYSLSQTRRTKWETAGCVTYHRRTPCGMCVFAFGVLRINGLISTDGGQDQFADP